MLAEVNVDFQGEKWKFPLKTIVKLKIIVIFLKFRLTGGAEF